MLVAGFLRTERCGQRAPHPVGWTRNDAVAGPREFELLEQAVETAKLQIPIAATYALEQAARVHLRPADGHVLGKLVIAVRR